MKFIFQGILIILFLVKFEYPGYSHDKTNIFLQSRAVSDHDSLLFKQLNDSAWDLRNYDPNKAVLLLDSIIKLAKEKKQNKSLTIAYNNLGIIYANIGDYEKAITWILKGFNIASENKDMVGTGRSMNNLAEVYRFQHQYDKALEYIKIAIDIHEKNKQVDFQAISCLNLAKIYQDMGKYKDALHFNKYALDILAKSKNPDLKVLARLHLAEIYIITRDFYHAKVELNNLWPISSKTDDLSNHFLYHELKGEYFFANYEFNGAENEFVKAYSVAKELKDLKLRMESLDKLVSLYEGFNDYRRAFKYQTEHHNLKDSLNNAQNYLLMSRIELQEEFDEKTGIQDRQNKIKDQLQQVEISQQKRISGYLLLVLIFLMVFGISAYVIYKQKLRNARIQASHRQEILLKNEALRMQMEEDREKTELIEFIDKQNEILSLVAKETNNAVFIIQPDGTIDWVNEAFERISGFSLAEYKRTRGAKIQDASFSETIKRDFNDCVYTKKPVSYISKSYTKDNEAVWIHTTLTPVLNNENEVERLIAIDSDITKIKLAQDVIDLKNQEITSSLEYASRIQSSILPLKSEMDSLFVDYFIINMPQNIVSGDFYWVNRKNGQVLAVVGDSTGHGVPGAFMSLLGISSLQEIVYKMENLEPALILEKLRERVIYLLHYGNSEYSASESWDMAICAIDENRMLKFAGSNNSVLILRDDVLIELKPDKFFIWDEQNDKKFTQQTFQLLKDDRIYLFTDGFIDQFGGYEEKKFSRRKLKKLLLDIYTLPMESQRELLNMVFKGWKGKNEQVDDIMVLGFSIT
jgi:PAS domain S-box-containing protein